MLPKARPQRLQRKSRDPGFASRGRSARSFMAAPLPGAPSGDDADESLMDGILEETGAVFAGSSLFKDEREKLATTAGCGGFSIISAALEEEHRSWVWLGVRAGGCFCREARVGSSRRRPRERCVCGGLFCAPPPRRRPPSRESTYPTCGEIPP